MSKNIFAIFAKDDSDDEKDQKGSGEPAPKPTKKELRAEDKIKREAYGDSVVKDPHQRPPRFDGPKHKGDYESGEKRPFERRSGTGRPAYAQDFKKGGHGKGNVGRFERESDLKDITKLKEDGVEGDKAAKDKKERATEPPSPAPVLPPKEEIMTVDEYLAKSGRQFDFQAEEAKKADPKALNIKDKEVKVVQPKAKEEPQFSKKPSRVTEHKLQGAPSPLLESVGSELEANGRKKVSKRAIKVDYNEHTFPALS